MEELHLMLYLMSNSEADPLRHTQVSVCNRSPAKVDATVARAKAENIATLVGHKEPKDFIASLSKPRKVVLLVMAGKPVDDTIKLLSEFMEEGDIIVDGGNEWYPNSIRRR